MEHECSWPFLYPVDSVALGVPFYYDVIKEPMDLSTIHGKIKSGKYANIEEFANDVRLVWRNAIIFNPKDSYICQFAQKLKDYFEQLYSKLCGIVHNDYFNKEKYLNEYENVVSELKNLVKEEEKLKKELHELEKENINIPSLRNDIDISTSPITYEERLKVYQQFQNLQTHHMTGLNKLLEQYKSEYSQMDESIYLNTDLMDVKLLRKIGLYINDCLNFELKKDNTITLKAEDVPTKPSTPDFPYGNNVQKQEIEKKNDNQESSSETSSESENSSSSDSSDEDEMKIDDYPSNNNNSKTKISNENKDNKNDNKRKKRK